LFPKCKLYLFDTFEGFDKKNFYKEDKLSNISADFSNTSVGLVLKKMQYPENCIIKKGFFPETTLGLEKEEYIFVSIDVDLYEPIYEGLKYFYPRLKKGGYIFVHDYNNFTSYSGTKKAVKQFSKENNITYFPLSDYLGSAIFMK
jgi:O-methyltransferase